jgi:diguanylate cyclase (GGDEF)-like protein
MARQLTESTAAGRKILATAAFALLLMVVVACLTVPVLVEETTEQVMVVAALLTAGALSLGLMWWRVARLVGELVTARQRAEASEARFIAAAGNSPDAFSTLEAVRDPHGRIVDFRVTYQNASTTKLWRDAGPSGDGALLSQFLPELLRATLVEAYAGVVRSGQALLEERQQVVAGDGPEWLEHHVVPLGEGVAVTWRDISQRHRAEERLKYLAQVDSLTGLPNRSVFSDRLEQALLRARRSGRPFALLFLDIDHFKEVNDRFGHAGGDALLRKLAERLRRSVRSADTVARLAGDEFTVILEELHEIADADRVAATVLRIARAPMQLDGQELTITLSIGIAIYESGDTGTTELLNRADSALYAVKRAGRNGFQRYSAALAEVPPDAAQARLAESGRWPVA